MRHSLCRKSKGRATYGPQLIADVRRRVTAAGGAQPGHGITSETAHHAGKGPDSHIERL